MYVGTCQIARPGRGLSPAPHAPAATLGSSLTLLLQLLLGDASTRKRPSVRESISEMLFFQSLTSFLVISENCLPGGGGKREGSRQGEGGVIDRAHTPSHTYTHNRLVRCARDMMRGSHIVREREREKKKFIRLS